MKASEVLGLAMLVAGEARYGGTFGWSCIWAVAPRSQCNGAAQDYFADVIDDLDEAEFEAGTTCEARLKNLHSAASRARSDEEAAS